MIRGHRGGHDPRPSALHIFASFCIIVLMLWECLAYHLPLPFEDPFFAWVHRQWLLDGVLILSFLAALAIAVEHWRRGAARLVPWWTSWWVVVVWAVVSFAWSIDRGASLRSATALIANGLLAWAVCSLSHTDRKILIWVRCLVLVALIASLEGVFQYFGSFQASLPLLERLRASGLPELQGWGGNVLEDFLVRKRIAAVFGWPNLFAGFLLLMIPLALGLSASSRGWTRTGWGIAAIGLFTCLILTLSVGGWIAAVITGVLVWRLMRNANRHEVAGRRLSRGLLVAIAALALGAIVLLTSFIVAKRARPLIASSTTSRIVYLLGTWQVIRAYPLRGTGIGTFGLAYAALMPARYVDAGHTALHAHNTLAEIAAELGVIGVACVLLFLSTLWRIAAAPLRDRRRDRLRWVRRGLAVGALGFFLHSLLEQTLVETITAPWWWIVVGLLTAAGAPALAQTQRADRREPHEPAGKSRQLRIRDALVPGVVACGGLWITLHLSLADVWACRGAFLDRANQPEAAIRAFETAQRWNLLESRYPLEEGERLARHLTDAPQELDAARAQFQRAAELSPWFGYAWLRVGLVQWKQGQLERAILSTRHALRCESTRPAALLQLAQLHYSTGAWVPLQQVARQLQARTPLDPRGWFFEAVAWYGLGQPERAMTLYRMIVQRFPAHYPSWFNLASLWQQAGNQAEAAAAYRAFLAHAPADQQFSRTLAQTFLAEAVPAKPPHQKNNP